MRSFTSGYQPSGMFRKRTGKDRVSRAMKYLYHKLKAKHETDHSSILTNKLKEAKGIKPKVKVIVRNGVEIFITVDNRKQWQENKLRLINYGEI